MEHMGTSIYTFSSSSPSSKTGTPNQIVATKWARWWATPRLNKLPSWGWIWWYSSWKKSQTTTWDIENLGKKWDFNYQPQLVSLPDFWTIKQYQLPCNFSQSWTSFFRDSKLTNALLILLSPCEVSCEVNPKFPSSFASGNGIFVWVVCWRGPSGPLRNQSAPKKKRRQKWLGY